MIRRHAGGVRLATKDEGNQGAKRANVKRPPKPRRLPLRVFAAVSGVLGVACLALGTSAALTPSRTPVTRSFYADLTAAYRYQATVAPDALYPQGGLAPANAPIFPNITTALAVQMEPVIFSTAPMQVSLHTNPVLRLFAKSMWQQDFPLGPGQAIKGVSPGLHPAVATWQVNVAGITADMNAIQKALQAAPSSYTVVLDPRLGGTVRMAGQTERITWDPKLTFSLQGNYWAASGRLAKTHVVHVQTVHDVPAYFTPFGLRLEPGSARNLFGGIGLLLVAVAILLAVLGREKREPLPAWQRIEQRHRSRIVKMSLNVQTLRRDLLQVESFDALLRIADDKELPVLRAESQDTVDFVVIDGDLAYVVRFPRHPADPAPAAESVAAGASEGM